MRWENDETKQAEYTDISSDSMEQCNDESLAYLINLRLTEAIRLLLQVKEVWINDDTGRMDKLCVNYPSNLPSFDDLVYRLEQIVFTEERRQPEYSGQKRRRSDKKLEVHEDHSHICPHCEYVHGPEEGTSEFNSSKVTLWCAKCGKEYYYIP